jgi:putative peptidoglycan lipid II flippase
VEPSTADVGQRLAGRYRLDECRSRNGGVEIWRAFDELLARSVGVHVVPVDHDRAKQLVEAAQVAATITDGRFLRILDAAEEDGLFYVVREWVGGSSLTMVLDAVGQMDSSDAQFMITEVAEALAAAHLSGMAHLCLDPDDVIFADNGQIKVTGLGVDAAVAGVTVPDKGQTDARAVGRILYAALTGRWPETEPAYGLATAPHTEGALATPRQVRAGVPAALDDIVDRILNEPPRHNGEPLTTPAAIAAALKTNPRPNRRLLEFRTDSDTAPTITRPGSPQPPHPSPEQLEDWGPSRGIRAARIVVGLLVIGGLVLFAVLFASNLLSGNDDPTSDSPTSEGTSTGTPPASDGPLAIATIRDFDPSSDNGEENRDQIDRVNDDDPGDGWTTQTYRDDPITRYKPGVGLVVDLGEATAFTSVALTMNEGDVLLDLLIADGDAIPEAIEDYDTVIPDHRSNGGTVELDVDDATEARFILIWFKELPPVSDGFRAEVFDVEVR